MKFLLSFLLLVVLNIYPQENYKQVKVFADPAAVAASGIDITEFILNKDNSITTFLSDSDYDKLLKSGLRHDIIVDDLSEYYKNLPQLTDIEKELSLAQSRTEYNVTGFTYGSMGGFYTYQEIIRDLDSMYARYPNLITQKQVIGMSHLNRPIYAVKISDNPNINEDEPGAGFDALVHAREPQSMATLMYFMWYLLENYGIDPTVTYLVNNRQIFFVPIFNPDGYEYNRSTNPAGGGMWRKNRRNNSSSDGVDLNRNFGYMWGYDNIGSSPTPSSETYRGPSAFSEPEAQAVRDYILGKNIGTYFNMHAWQDAILYPWGYINAQTPDAATYAEFSSDMCALNGYSYGTVYQVLGYTSNGSIRDWLYGEQVAKNKIYGYTIEIGNSSDYFWPPQSRIFPIAQQNVGALMYQSYVAGDYTKLNGYTLQPQHFNPGDVVEMTPVIKNKGLSSAYGVTFTLTSLSQYAYVNNGTVVIDSIPARSEYSLASPLTINIAHAAPVSEYIPFAVTLSKNGNIYSADTLRLITGVPVYTFIDTSAVIDSNWTVTASPSTPKWEATTAAFFSPPVSYTDSKTGNYVSNATVTMTTKNNIDLTGILLPRLSFQTKYDIEANWDCGVLLVSTNNGSTWTPLSGQYTAPASGQGKQVPAGMPVYESSQLGWVQEDIDLSPYSNAQIKLRFELRTDGSLNKDGWYVDDIRVFYYGMVPVELTSFSAEETETGRLLRWTTSTETNNKGFEVERSLNKTEWAVIGFVAGKGTSTEIANYSFTDKENYSGTVYYRLRQIDYDGSFTYSSVVESHKNIITQYSLEQNYPNPFNPSTIIKYSVPADGQVNLSVYNMLGEKVIELENRYMQAGQYSAEFDGRSMNSGIYFYKLQSSGYTKTLKMILIK